MNKLMNEKCFPYSHTVRVILWEILMKVLIYLYYFDVSHQKVVQSNVGMIITILSFHHLHYVQNIKMFIIS